MPTEQTHHDKILSSGKFITNDFIKQILTERDNCRDVQVLNVDVRPAVGAGDNYLSFMYRLVVEYSKSGNEVEKCVLIIKGAPSSKLLMDFIENLGIFTKEISMYKSCLPMLKKYQDEYFPDEVDFISAHFYNCSLENTIVMEDLTKSGYKMANRRQQLNFDHCVVALRSLARFHALSVITNHHHPDIVESVSGEFYVEVNRPTFGPYLDKALSTLSDVVKDWSCSADIVQALKAVSVDSFDRCQSVIKSSVDTFCVLNHGDYWINNMMFKYDTRGHVHHAKLVDYQLARYASPALDLLYFLFTSPQCDIIEHRTFELIELYYNCLKHDLKQLNIDSDQFTLELLKDEIKNRAFFGVLVITTILPIIVANPEDALDVDSMTEEQMKTCDYGEEFPLMKNYRDPCFKKAAGAYLRFMEENGYLEAAKNMKYTVNNNCQDASEQKI